MTVLKATLVLLLVTAAAVIGPYRRAQRAFAATSPQPAFAAASRGAIRRRVSRPAIGRAPTRGSKVQYASAQTSVAARRGGRRTRAVATLVHASRTGTVQEASRQSTSVASQNSSGHIGPALPDRPERFFHAQHFQAASPTPPLAAATQVVRDIPKPPPKLIAHSA